MVYRQIIPRPVQFIKDQQSSIQVILFSSASNTSERCPRGTMGMGKPKMRMTDILHAHRSCNVVKWKDHSLQ